MSIAAKVVGISYFQNHSAKLFLEDANQQDCAGQLIFCADGIVKHSLDCLIGEIVWGGSGFLMLGNRQVAKRIGYTRIVFGFGEPRFSVMIKKAWDSVIKTP